MNSALRFLIGALLAIVALELLARVLPVSSATHTAYSDGSDLLTYPPGHQWTAATGWDLKNAQQMKANNAGFAADVDWTHDPKAIGLVGDSYVEASMLPSAQRPAAQLADALGGHTPVYALGAPGTALLDYAYRMAWAQETFGVRRFVVMVEAGDVRQSWCGSGNVHAHCLDAATGEMRVEKLPPPSMAKTMFRESALAQYLVSQLRLDPNKLVRRLFADAAPSEPHAVFSSPLADEWTVAQRVRTQERAEKVTAAFTRMLQDVKVDSLLFVVNANTAPPKAGERSAPPLPPALEQERTHLIAALRREGYQVLDAAEVFESHWHVSRLALEVGPYDGHLNGLAVGLLMKRAAEVLDTRDR